MGIGKTIQTLEIKDVAGGCNYTDDIAAISPEQSPNSMNVEFVNGRLRKRKGYAALNATIGSGAVGFSLVDFGRANGQHSQVTHFGDKVYSFSNITDTYTTLRTSVPKVRSYNAKVGSYLIQTYEDNSTEYYWNGTTASMALLSATAPGFKRAIEFQGYLMGMNTAAFPMRVYYQSTGDLIDGAYADYLTLTPAPNDDEITDPFLLNGRLYMGTNYSIFRMSFVGGVTVFEFKQIISDVGIIPGTTQLVVTRDYGQVAIFLGTDKRVYMFDGANIKVISDLYFYSNKDTAIAMDLLDDDYINNAFSVYDNKNRVYRLFVTRKADERNQYCLNIHVDTFSYYPFDNMPFASGAVCYDALQRPVMLCAGYDGILYKMFIDTITDNGAPINEFYTSPLLSVKDHVLKQAQTLDIQVYPSSNASLKIYDRVDYARVWRHRQDVPLASKRDKFLGGSFVLGSAVLGSEREVLNQCVNLPVGFNQYQMKMMSDTPAGVGWEVLNIKMNQSATVFGRAEAVR